MGDRPIRTAVAALALGVGLAGFGPAVARPVELTPVPLPESRPCVSPEEWDALRRTGERNLARLAAESGLPPVDRTSAVVFEWPMRPAPGFSDPGYHAVLNFVDHDFHYPERLLDYECGDRSYDTPSGVNHNGTDYVLWPFAWHKVVHSQIEVVAAAAGTIFDREDGHDDHCGSGASNKIALLHADGTRAWYLHLKKGSVTAKGIGATVAVGEYLGVVGSSGNSSWPHLHFDLRDENWDTFDPYGGPCNPNGPGSWWSDQRPYFDSGVNAVLTHSAPPVFPTCPQEEILNLQNEFSPGDSVHCGIYHREFVLGQVAGYALLDPSGAVADSGSYGIAEPFHPVAFALPGYELPPSAAPGEWKVVVDYEGVRYEHAFTVLPGTASPEAGAPEAPAYPAVELRVDPNPFRAATRIAGTLARPGPATLVVYDAAGRRVRELADRAPGAAQLGTTWDGRDDAGRSVASGVYFVRLTLRGELVVTKRVVRLQ